MITDKEASLVKQAKEAIQRGAYTFIEKPIQTNGLERILVEIKTKK